MNTIPMLQPAIATAAITGASGGPLQIPPRRI